MVVLIYVLISVLVSSILGSLLELSLGIELLVCFGCFIILSIGGLFAAIDELKEK